MTQASKPSQMLQGIAKEQRQVAAVQRGLGLFKARRTARHLKRRDALYHATVVIVSVKWLC